MGKLDLMNTPERRRNWDTRYVAIVSVRMVALGSPNVTHEGNTIEFSATCNTIELNIIS